MQKSPVAPELFEELYGAMPQAILWMSPIRNPETNEVTDFHLAYLNQEALNYMGLDRKVVEGSSIYTTPTLEGSLRDRVFQETLQVYNSGEKFESTLYNGVLKKHVHVLRSRLRDGVITIIQNITGEREIISELKRQKKQLENQTS